MVVPERARSPARTECVENHRHVNELLQHGADRWRNGAPVPRIPSPLRSSPGPSQILWRAMWMVRRPMRIASTTRDTSSTNSTTSAASAVMPPP